VLLVVLCEWVDIMQYQRLLMLGIMEMGVWSTGTV